MASPKVRKAVREVLRSGASQIKIMASGSITGAHDPLDVVEYTPGEMRAIVEEAEKWGTDGLGSLEVLDPQSQEFTCRKKYFSDLEILQQATSLNGELLALSGPRSPYPDGPLGVIAEGAYADLLIVDGNPLEDISVLTRTDKTLRLIMKDGKIYKNTLNKPR